MDFWQAIVAGAVVAIIASLIKRGKTGLPWYLTWLVGIGGAIGGLYIARALDVADTPGIDWIRWAISVVLAIVLIGVARTIFGRRK